MRNTLSYGFVIMLLCLSFGFQGQARAETEKKVYVLVRFQEDVEAEKTAKSLRNQVQGEIKHVYSHVFKGGAFVLPVSHISDLLESSKVEHVELNRKMSVH